MIHFLYSIGVNLVFQCSVFQENVIQINYVFSVTAASPLLSVCLVVFKPMHAGRGLPSWKDQVSF